MSPYAPQIFEPTQKPESGFGQPDTDLPLASGLVGLWNFTGPGTFEADLTGNGNHLAMTGPTWVASPDGPAVQFLSSGQFAGCGPLVSATSAMSVAVRFRCPQLSASQQWICSRDQNSFGFTIVIEAGTTQPFVAMVLSSPSLTTPGVHLPAITPGKYYTVMGVWNPAVALTAYCSDGNSGLTAAAGATSMRGNNFRFGQGISAATQFADQIIFGAMWNRALSADEAKSYVGNPYQIFRQQFLTHEALSGYLLMLRRRAMLNAA